jgi:outer membrane protein assembly factor BamB
MRTQRQRRTVLGLLVVLVAALVAAAISPAVARAAPVPRLTLDSSGGPVGTEIVARGSGYAAGETVQLVWDTFAWASATTTANGTAIVTFSVPESAQPGVHQIWLTGRTGGRTAGAMFAVRTDWSQLGGGPGHEGGGVHAPALGRFGPAWTFELGGNAGRGSGAVVSGGAVYAATSRGYVTSLTTGGAYRWQRDLVQTIVGTPAVADDRLIVAQRNGTVVGLDILNGITRWATPLRGVTTVGPALGGGLVVVGLADGRLVALDAATGAIVWTVAGTGAVTTVPTFAGGLVVAARGTEVAAVDTLSGDARWSTTIGGSGATGAVVWSRDVRRVSVVSPGAGLVGLDTLDGTVVWTVSGVRGFTAPPGAGLLYAERDLPGGTVIARVIASSGRLLATVKQPVVPSANGLVILGGATGYLFGIASDGNLRAYGRGAEGPDVQLWSARTGATTAPIAAPDGALYVVTNGGVLTKFAS